MPSLRAARLTRRGRSSPQGKGRPCSALPVLRATAGCARVVVSDPCQDERYSRFTRTQSASRAGSSVAVFVLAEHKGAGFSPRKYAMRSALAPLGCGRPSRTCSDFTLPRPAKCRMAAATFAPRARSQRLEASTVRCRHRPPAIPATSVCARYLPDAIRLIRRSEAIRSRYVWIRE